MSIIDIPVSCLYSVLLDVDNYKDFLPWCKEAKILRKLNDCLEAQMTILFAGIEESYVSKVFFENKNPEDVTINIVSESDLFEFMHSSWRLQKVEDGTRATFEISLKLKNKILDKVVSVFFSKACNKVMQAFEARARTLHKTINK
ncbi:type II toxin-antitoxin system RatA family toxin [Candidatus Cyrtobacter comes]|uniref:type II toxin-antitoxin system RatA family toxin n=1 Tax=Candidatus Cyrtobacter comes TaxID=675776 RepID=UPI002ACD6E7A|nr:type II toxin-antitoxin system RatA family toxin [Candidatus Cyrtobacter comes]